VHAQKYTCAIAPVCQCHELLSPVPEPAGAGWQQSLPASRLRKLFIFLARHNDNVKEIMMVKANNSLLRKAA